jgi:hypothetical protein
LKPLSYIQFLWKSDNAHGIHSPFVFTFLSEGLYGERTIVSKRKHQTDPEAANLSYNLLDTLFKTILYFKAYNLVVLGEDSAAVTKTLREAGEKISSKIWFFSPHAHIPGAIGLAYLSVKSADELQPLLKQLQPNITQNTAYAIGNIHSSVAMERVWETIQKDPNVTVTVDTYHLGIFFYRHGQAKQHFTIRPSTSKILNAFLGIKKLWGLIG